MKKPLALAALLFVTGCTTSKVNQPPVANKPVEAAKASPAVSEADLTTREKQIWDAIAKKNYGSYGDLLAGDYLEVSSEANYDKAGSVGEVQNLALTDTTFSDWKFIPVDKDLALITYTVAMKGSLRTTPLPPSQTRATSLWINRDGKWLVVYHQESEVPKTPPPPSAARAATPAASPSESPATTGADPIANEKIVWTHFRNRNFDAVAALMVPEFIEVEPEAVHDKAAAVKALEQVDFSRFTQSDWKALLPSANAALVTYTLKGGPGNVIERHTTIWANRNGKWQAVFHQGTAVPAK